MTPNPKAQAQAERDREIEHLSVAVEQEKAETQTVVDGLRVSLRHNRLLSAAIRSAAGLPSAPPIPMPYKHDGD